MTVEDGSMDVNEETAAKLAGLTELTAPNANSPLNVDEGKADGGSNVTVATVSIVVAGPADVQIADSWSVPKSEQ